MAWFRYDQNNSSGRFESPALDVYVEATTPKAADARAEELGLYFDGMVDCSCCGSRWQKADDHCEVEADENGRPALLTSRAYGSKRAMAGGFPVTLIAYANGKTESIDADGVVTETPVSTDEKKKKKKEQKKPTIARVEPETLFAFWPYDNTFIGAEVIGFLDDGTVTAVGYPGMKFKPVLILPFTEGKERLTMLNELQEKTRASIKQANRVLAGVSHTILGLTPPKES